MILESSPGLLQLNDLELLFEYLSRRKEFLIGPRAIRHTIVDTVTL